MSRLTKKIDLQEFGSVYSISSAFISEIPNKFLDKDYVGKAPNKLGQLEDLEEEIGCPLEVVCKALKEGIIIDSELPKYKVIIGFEENELFLYIKQKFSKWKYKTKDYKKTWWLKSDRSE